MEEMESRIKARTKKMFDSGLIDEIKTILASGFSKDLKPLNCVGYRECLEYISGEYSLAETESLICLHTRQLAKRQRTWFRGQAPQAVWLYPEENSVLGVVREFLSERGRAASDGCGDAEGKGDRGAGSRGYTDGSAEKLAENGAADESACGGFDGQFRSEAREEKREDVNEDIRGEVREEIRDDVIEEIRGEVRGGVKSKINGEIRGDAH
jgi:hypothetical protein